MTDETRREVAREVERVRAERSAEACDACMGTGRDDEAGDPVCPTCDGTGDVPREALARPPFLDLAGVRLLLVTDEECWQYRGEKGRWELSATETPVGWRVVLMLTRGPVNAFVNTYGVGADPASALGRARAAVGDALVTLAMQITAGGVP